MSEQPERDQFEAWISAAPYEKDIRRYDQAPTSAWPGQYRDIDVQLAWEAWKAGRRRAQA
jgi:hypothetical protein